MIDHTQYVFCDGQSTAPHKVMCRVLKGSVLGLLLFALYTAENGPHHPGTWSSDDMQLNFFSTHDRKVLHWSCMLSHVSMTLHARWLQFFWSWIQLNHSFSRALRLIDFITLTTVFSISMMGMLCTPHLYRSSAPFTRSWWAWQPTLFNWRTRAMSACNTAVDSNFYGNTARQQLRCIQSWLL